MHTHANILAVIQILTRCLCEWINPRLYWNEAIYGKGNCDTDLTQAPSLFSGSDRRCQCCLQETKDSSDKVNAEILFTNCPNTTFEGIAGIFFLNKHLYFHFFRLNSSMEHETYGRLMKGVFYQRSAYAFCLIPEMLCNLELMLSNNSLTTDRVVYGLRRLS